MAESMILPTKSLVKFTLRSGQMRKRGHLSPAVEGRAPAQLVQQSSLFVRQHDAGCDRGKDRHKVGCHAKRCRHDLRHGFAAGDFDHCLGNHRAFWWPAAGRGCRTHSGHKAMVTNSVYYLAYCLDKELLQWGDIDYSWTNLSFCKSEDRSADHRTGAFPKQTV